MKPTGAGKMLHRLTIQANQAGTTDTQFGQPAPNWQDLFTCWASIEPLSGRELWQAQEVQADVTHRIRIKWNPDTPVGPRNRGVLKEEGGRVFNFRAVLNVEERNIEWEILAVEVV